MPDTIRPDGVLPDEPPRHQPHRARRQRAKRAPDGEQALMRRRELWVQRDLPMPDRLRQFFGFRRRAEPERFRAPAPGVSPEVIAEDRRSIRRGLPLAAAALGFATVSVLVMWIYGLLEKRPVPADAAAMGDPVMEAARALQRRDVAKARRLYTEALRQDRRNPAVHFLEGHLIAMEGGQAAQDLAARVQRTCEGRASPRQLLTAAGYLMATNDDTRCLQALRRAVAMRPRDLPLRFLVLQVLLLRGQYETALAEAEEYEKLGGSAGVAAEARGRSLLALGQPAAAQRQFESALAFGPLSVDLRLGLADALNQQGRPDRALQQLALAARIDPRNADVFLAEGAVHDGLGNVAAAEAAYRRSLALDPGNVQALNNLAYLLAERRNRPAEALEVILRAYRLAPDTPAVLDTLACIYQKLGRDADAWPLLEKALARAPQDEYTRLHVAVAHKRRGNLAEAKALLQELVRTAKSTDVRRQAQMQLAAG